jgi:hypothetical protein
MGKILKGKNVAKVSVREKTVYTAQDSPINWENV